MLGLRLLLKPQKLPMLRLQLCLLGLDLLLGGHVFVQLLPVISRDLSNIFRLI